MVHENLPNAIIEDLTTYTYGGMFSYQIFLKPCVLIVRVDGEIQLADAINIQT